MEDKSRYNFSEWLQDLLADYVLKAHRHTVQRLPGSGRRIGRLYGVDVPAQRVPREPQGARPCRKRHYLPPSHRDGGIALWRTEFVTNH